MRSNVGSDHINDLDELSIVPKEMCGTVGACQKGGDLRNVINLLYVEWD
jgi:hypothetical protein